MHTNYYLDGKQLFVTEDLYESNFHEFLRNDDNLKRKKLNHKIVLLEIFD